MLVAAAGAIALGQWSEAAAVVFLFAIAQTLEARTLDRARIAIRALMDLTPTDALVRDAAGERRVAVDQIAPGRDHRRETGREDSARRRGRRRRERREPGAGHRRVAAGRQERRATRCLPARSTAAARSTCG